MESDPDDFDHASDKEKRYYFWVGKLVKSWAQFDVSLFGLCAVTMRPLFSKARIIYWRISSVDVRITTVSDLLESHLMPQPLKSGEHPPAEWTLWKDIRKDAKDSLEYRNFIAHSPKWTSYIPGKPAALGKRQPAEPIYHSKHHLPDAERRRPKDFGPSDVSAMKKHIDEVSRVSDQIETLAKQLEKRQLEHERQQSQLERDHWMAQGRDKPRPRR